MCSSDLNDSAVWCFFDGLTDGTVITYPGGTCFVNDLTAGLGTLSSVDGVIIEQMGFDNVASIVTVGATMLLAPLLWDHYLVSLLLPAAFLLDRGRPWGIALPLLAWLPAPLLPFVAIAGMLLPFLAPAPPAAGPGPYRPLIPALAWRKRPG